MRIGPKKKRCSHSPDLSTHWHHPQFLSLIPHGLSYLKFQIFLTEQYAKPTFLFLSFLFLRCVQLKLAFSFFKHLINLTACKSYVLSQKKHSYVRVFFFFFIFLLFSSPSKLSKVLSNFNYSTFFFF